MIRFDSFHHFFFLNGVDRCNSRVVQQQNNGIEFFPGPVVGSQRHDEVVEAVSCRLSRYNDEFVFKTVRFSIFKTVVPATLRRGQKYTGAEGLF